MTCWTRPTGASPSPIRTSNSDAVSAAGRRKVALCVCAGLFLLSVDEATETVEAVEASWQARSLSLRSDGATLWKGTLRPDR